MTRTNARAQRLTVAADRRPLLCAAALYNLSWGLTAVVAPQRLAQALGFDATGDGMGWRAAGVVVMAYAPAYLWAADHPRKAQPILATALCGKVLGVSGWLAGAATRRFGLRTVLLPLLNDAACIPSLVHLLLETRERKGDCS